MIAFCKDRDQTVFTELMRRNQEMVRRVLGKYGEQLAEDLTQETFLAILTKPERYDSRNNFQGWLVTIAMNTARDHFRAQHAQRRSRATDALSDYEEAKNIPVADPLAAERAQRVVAPSVAHFRVGA